MAFKVKIFKNPFRYVSWDSRYVAVGWEVAKTSFALTSPIAPKFPERSRPLACACVLTLVWIGCGLPDLFLED